MEITVKYKFMKYQFREIMKNKEIEANGHGTSAIDSILCFNFYEKIYSLI